MKGLVFLFLLVILAVLGWINCTQEARDWAKTVTKRNLIAFVIGILAVAAAIAFSLNGNIQLV